MVNSTSSAIFSSRQNSRIRLVCVLLLTSFFIFAQPRLESPSGKVKDSLITSIKITGVVLDGAPLRNIVVIEKGTDNLAITDKDGMFSLDIPIDHFVNKKVWLRFEVLTRIPLERKVSANTKFLEIHYTQKTKSRRWRVDVDEEQQSDAISDLIGDAIDKLIDIARNSKHDNDSDGNNAGYREVKSSTPRF